jgi:hypothetical protein
MENQALLAKKENVVTRATEGIMVILVPLDVMVPQDVLVLQVSICVLWGVFEVSMLTAKS